MGQRLLRRRLRGYNPICSPLAQLCIFSRCNKKYLAQALKSKFFINGIDKYFLTCYNATANQLQGGGAANK